MNIDLRELDPEADLDLLVDWMNRPHVMEWWSHDGPPDVVGAYLRQQCALGYLTPWVASADGVPVAYVETYRVIDDPLSASYEFGPADLGWHVLVGPPEALGTGIPRAIAAVVVGRLLDTTGTERVFCEPNARNARMIRFCEHLGFRRVATLELPDKTAALMMCTRASFDDAVGRAAERA